MEPDLLKWWAPLGVGGVLAAMMFLFYRQDRLACKDREKMVVEALEHVATAQQAVASNVLEVSHTVQNAMERQGADMRMLVQHLMTRKEND